MMVQKLAACKLLPGKKQNVHRQHSGIWSRAPENEATHVIPIRRKLFFSEVITIFDEQ